MLGRTLKQTTIAAALSLAFLAGGIASGDNLNVISSVQAQETKKELPDFAKLVEDNGKAVVSITMSKKAPARKAFQGRNPSRDQLDQLRRFGFPFPPDFFGGEEMMPERAPRKGQGSGFIISKDGLIFTNHHVVDGADEIKVRLTDGREFNAKVLGSDAKTDIAVIKIDAKDLPVVKIGDSNKVRVGEWVAAIGAPFGLENTVTSGIVSAKSRNLPSDQFVPFIQTDAAVNPGNSGGPLFNMNGEVIGINSQIFSTSGGFMGLSFAIPIDLAMQIKDDLVRDGHVKRGKLGVMIQSMSPELAKSFGLDNAKGALIAQIEEGSAAQKGGLEEGDIVLEFAGKKIESSGDLSRAVASAKPNSKNDVKVLREGKEKTITVTLDDATDKTAQAQAAENKGRLGVAVRPLNDEEKKIFKDGLYVEQATGAAAEAGIQSGDIILSVAGKRLKNFEQLKDAVAKAKDTLALQIARNGNRNFVVVKLNAKDKK